MSTTSSKETALQYSGVRKAGTKPMASSPPPHHRLPNPAITLVGFILRRRREAASPWRAVTAEEASLLSPPCTRRGAVKIGISPCLGAEGGGCGGRPGVNESYQAPTVVACVGALSRRVSFVPAPFGQVLMAKVTSVDRGACIRDLSQYPGEVRRGMREHAHTQDERMRAKKRAHTHTSKISHAHPARTHTEEYLWGGGGTLCCPTGAHAHPAPGRQEGNIVVQPDGKVREHTHTHTRTHAHAHWRHARTHARRKTHIYTHARAHALTHSLSGGVPVGAGHLRAARQGPPPGARCRPRRRRPQAPRHRHSCQPKRQRQGPHRRGDGIRMCVRVCVCVCLDASGKAVTVKAQSFPPPPLAQVRAAQTGSSNARALLAVPQTLPPRAQPDPPRHFALPLPAACLAFACVERGGEN